MSRSARIVIPGYPYHITQRGNYRQNVLIDDDDRIKYQFLLSEESEEDIKIIRKHTILGRPLGTDDFIAKMSRRANKVLTVMQKGRPRKNI